MKKFLLGLALLAVAGCNSPKRELRRTLANFVGQEIRLPDGLQSKQLGEDVPDPGFRRKDWRIVVYTDSTGCSECKLRNLVLWKDVIRANDSLSVPAGIVFVFHPKKVRELGFMLKNYEFDYPVYYDLEGEFERLNPGLPKDVRFHTFLLDPQNRVAVVGSPVRNEKLWKLYRDEMETPANP